MVLKVFYIVFFLILSNTAIASDYTFSVINSGDGQKMAAHVLTKVYQSIGIDIGVDPAPAKRAEQLASSGQTDGEILRVWSYGVDNPSVLRVPTPYYSLRTMAFVKKGSDVIINHLDDLKKYKLIKVRGFKHTDSITKGIDGVFVLDGSQQMMRFLDNERADIALTSFLSGELTLKRMDISDIVAYEKPLAELPLYHYIHKNNADLVPIIDQKFKQIKANGELRRLFEIEEQKLIDSM